MVVVASKQRPTSVEDGFGSEWMTCNAEDCDLQVVRPGKVQCSGMCQEVGWPDDEEAST